MKHFAQPPRQPDPLSDEEGAADMLSVISQISLGEEELGWRDAGSDLKNSRTRGCVGGRRVCAVTRGFMVIIFVWLCRRERTWAMEMCGGIGVRVRVWWVVVRTARSDVRLLDFGLD